MVPSLKPEDLELLVELGIIPMASRDSWEGILSDEQLIDLRHEVLDFMDSHAFGADYELNPLGRRLDDIQERLYLEVESRP